MPTSVINSYVTPESTSSPVVHEDLARLVKQMMQGDVMRFGSATERDAVFTTLGVAPPVGSLAYLQDVDWYTRYTSAASWSPLAGKFVGESVRTSAVGTFTTTETLLDSLTVTLLANARVKVYHEVSLQSSATDVMSLILRYKAGSTADTSGTQLAIKTVSCDVANRGSLATNTRTLTLTTAGAYTFVGSALRSSGTGNVQSFGSAAQENVLRIVYE